MILHFIAFILLLSLSQINVSQSYLTTRLVLRKQRTDPYKIAHHKTIHHKACSDIASTIILSVGDYSAEIENAVGSEIYGPIFKAGLFIFASGFISAFVAAFIVSKSDSWEELGSEFERGKEAQLLDMSDQNKAAVNEEILFGGNSNVNRENTENKIDATLDEVNKLDL
jgi:hypothetical protein